MTIRTLAAVCVAVAAGVVTHAHPMGNFSVNRFARFEVRAQGVVLTYILELAEEPAFELIAGWKLDPVRDRSEAERRAAATAEGWVRRLRISQGGTVAAGRLEQAEARVSPGAGGLPVLRVAMRISVPGGAGWVEYEDGNYAGRTGWSEIVVAPDAGVRLEASTHGAGDRSGMLTSFPGEPPRDLKARFRWAAGEGAGAGTVVLPRERPGPETAPAASGGREPGSSQRDYLSRLLGGPDVTPWMLAAGLGVAFGLGAMHALSPGHGKSLVAAYLVGSRGTMRHALLLGGVVTFTHTVSVFALGLGVLLFERYLAPDRVLPVLGVISGLSIVGVGGWLLYRRAGALHRQLQQAPGQPVWGFPQHDGHGHQHAHGPMPEGEVSMAALITLGVSGGLVPCPSALVLLLMSVGLGRVGLGLGLLVAFSAGLAAVLILIGAAVLYAKHLLPERPWMNPAALRYVPVVSAAVVIVLGLFMTGASLGWIPPGFAG